MHHLRSVAREGPQRTGGDRMLGRRGVEGEVRRASGRLAWLLTSRGYGAVGAGVANGIGGGATVWRPPISDQSAAPSPTVHAIHSMTQPAIRVNHTAGPSGPDVSARLWAISVTP